MSHLFQESKQTALSDQPDQLPAPHLLFLDHNMDTTHLDALIVGAGFGGIYQLHTLRAAGLNVKVIDAASDVGGTWFWNRYPGAMSDTESFVYRFSWDKEDLQSYSWKNHYVKQPEVLAYLEHVVQKYDLRKDMQFNTEMLSATWEEDGHWNIQTISGNFRARYLVTALGVLSRPNYPAIPGLGSFKGTLCHTAKWDTNITLHDKRVGIIGCGSTGVQVITEIAKNVKQLVCFQRHPQYSVPSGDGPASEAYRKQVNENYSQIIDQVKNSQTGFGFVESTRPFNSVPENEREAIFEELWRQGNGFRFMFGGFSDLTIDRTANEAACSFIRNKIGEIVQDPVKAAKLMPSECYARRPLCDGGYYEQFNRSHVDIVNLQDTPITTVNETGMRTADGKDYKLDVLILATGFDAVDGNYNRLRIHGVGGITLKDHWKHGPTTYLGLSVPQFPNLFMIVGPQGPFCNVPPAIEAHVEFITRMILNAEELRKRQGSLVMVDATPEGEAEWCDLCEQQVEGSLFKETQSWIFGANIPDKKLATRFYFGGLGKYRAELEQVIANNWRGYRIEKL